MARNMTEFPTDGMAHICSHPFIRGQYRIEKVMFLNTNLHWGMKSSNAYIYENIYRFDKGEVNTCICCEKRVPRNNRPKKNGPRYWLVLDELKKVEPKVRPRELNVKHIERLWGSHIAIYCPLTNPKYFGGFDPKKMEGQNRKKGVSRVLGIYVFTLIAYTPVVFMCVLYVYICCLYIYILLFIFLYLIYADIWCVHI